MPFLQELFLVLLHLPLERGQIMLRHTTHGGNAAVAQPELRFLPTLAGVYMRRLPPISAVEQENPAPPSQDRRHAVVFPPINGMR